MDELIAPDYSRAVLITIDMQVDTLDGQPLEIPGTSAAIPNAAALCRAFRNSDRPIVHIVRLYRADGSNAEACRRKLVQEAPLLRPGTRGRLLAPGLVGSDTPDLNDDLLLAGMAQEIADNEVVIYKPRWGAFFGTPLDAHLSALEAHTLVFAGANFPNCPRTSIYEASERDYRIVAVADAISGLYDKGRDELANIGVAVLRTLDVIAALTDTTATTATKATTVPLPSAGGTRG